MKCSTRSFNCPGNSWSIGSDDSFGFWMILVEPFNIYKYILIFIHLFQNLPSVAAVNEPLVQVFVVPAVVSVDGGA